MREDVKKLFDQYNGMLTQKRAVEVGIHPNTLVRMVAKQEIIQVYPGIYALPDQFVDQFYAVQQKLTKGIYSHETALLLHNATDLNIGRLDMTFPRGYIYQRLKGDYPIIPHSTKKKLHELGIIEMGSPYGNRIRVYDMERTICDLWSKNSQSEAVRKNEAVRNYFASDQVDLRKLRKYMRMFNVDEKLKTVLEVLSQ